MKARLPIIFFALFASSFAEAQLNVTTNMTPAQLVQNVLLGNGVTASNIMYNGVPYPATAQPGSGAFTNGANTNLGIAAGIILSSGLASSIPAPASNESSDATATGSDPDLVAIAGGEITDRAVLEFDFMVTGDSLKFNYVFGSEEYPDFVCQYNDAFGFFLSGPGISGPYSNGAINIALVPGTNMPVTINNVNDGASFNPNCPPTNSQYFVDNSGGNSIVYNGFTTVLTAEAQVICGQTYHIKLAIGDFGNGYGDEVLDSGVFLQAGSFVSTGQVIPSLSAGVSVNDSTMYEGCGIIPFNFTRMGDTSNIDTVHLLVGGTSTPGVDYYPAIPTELIYQPGDSLITIPLTVPYDADGIETLTIRVTQNVVCSGLQVTNNYTFYIDQYPPLIVVTNDVMGACGQSYDIGPQVSAGAGDYGYLWSDGETTPTIHVAVDTTTTFYVTVTDTCSVAPVSDSITVFIPAYAPLTATVSPDVAIPCLGNDTIAVNSTSGGNGNYTYQWSLGGNSLSTDSLFDVPASAPSWYVVEIGEGCGHTISDSVLVSTAPLPPLQILSWDSTVFCTGDSVLLIPFGVTGGNGVYTYAWTNDTGAVLSTADTLLVGVPQDYSYMLSIHDQCGYSADSVFTTLIPHYAPFTIALTADTTICTGDSIRLLAQVGGGSGVHTIDWEGWDWSDPYLTYSGDVDTTFIVDVSDHCGEFISGMVHVTVEHPKTKILIANQGEDDWLFQATTVPFSVPVMIWDLGDGTRIKSTSVTHSYLNLEDHWVTLHTISEAGCPAEDSLLVVSPATLYFPNAFTPDGDGVNDVFGPVGRSIEEFQMTIFDRWGHVVYDTDDMLKPWDGKVLGGEDAVTGVYVYRYRAKGHYFEARKGYGHVTLLRGSTGR